MIKKEELKSVNRLFGLIGYPLSHSFSKKFFGEKFKREEIAGCHYELFPLEQITDLPKLLKEYPNLIGLNVTIPYKEQVIPYLDSLDEGAAAVGAVNTIKIKDGELRGYNTDVYGFKQSLLNAFSISNVHPEAALVLGTGGAAKAVAFVLEELNLPFRYVSRKDKDGAISYEQLDAKIMTTHTLIINTTPLGMAPNIGTFPDIPYHYMNDAHLAYDLVYNPEETAFLAKAKERGAGICGGLEMLHLQAIKAWSIWNS